MHNPKDIEVTAKCAPSIPRPKLAGVTVNRTIRMVIVVLLAGVIATANENGFAQRADAQFDDLNARAAAARDDQNLPLAIELYDEAVKLKPDSAEGWFYIGLLQYTSNGFSAAINAFDHFLQLRPDAPPALALRGLSEFENGAYDDALRDLDEGVAKGAANDPRNEQIIRYHLAQLLTRAGRFDDAVTQYQFFANKQIDNPELRMGLGLAAMRTRILPRDVPAENREFLQSVGSAGYTFMAGDSDSADRQFDQLFSRYPDAPNLYFYYGSLLFRHGPELAVDQFRREVAHTPRNAYAHAMLAFTLMIVGRYAEAAPEAQLALQADPSLEMAQLALGRALADTGDTTRADQLLKQVLQQDPDNLEAHMGLADMYARMGKRDDAYRERMLCLGLQK